MNIDLTPIFQAIIALLAALVTYKLVPWIKARTTESQQALLSAIPQIAFDANSSLQSTLSGDLPSPIDPPPGCVFHTRCPYACEQCRKQAPALADIGGGHYAACHFPGRFSPAHPA